MARARLLKIWSKTHFVQTSLVNSVEGGVTRVELDGGSDSGSWGAGVSSVERSSGIGHWTRGNHSGGSEGGDSGVGHRGSQGGGSSISSGERSSSIVEVRESIVSQGSSVRLVLRVVESRKETLGLSLLKSGLGSLEVCRGEG